jgi:hypothetical protein
LIQQNRKRPTVNCAGLRVAHKFLAVGQAQRQLVAIYRFQADALKTGVGNKASRFIDQLGFLLL